MHDFKATPLQLDHRSLISDHLAQLHIELSEYTFANLYLFRHLHRYELIFWQDFIFIKGITRDSFSFFMPTVPLSHLSPSSIIELLQEVDYLFPIPEPWLADLDPEFLTWHYLEQDSDYLFSTSKIRTYPGRHLSKKRNLIYQLFRSYEVDVKPLNTDTKQDAFAILDTWQAKHPLIETDFSSCQEALYQFEALHLNGLILYADRKPEAFLIGEENHDEYIIHFSKGSHHIKGLYPYLYQTLAQQLNPSCQWINMEQDLGLPQMHQSKHSYEPDRMAHKWRLSLKK